jgi:hypothetical protein
MEKPDSASTCVVVAAFGNAWGDMMSICRTWALRAEAAAAKANNAFLSDLLRTCSTAVASPIRRIKHRIGAPSLG